MSEYSKNIYQKIQETEINSISENYIELNLYSPWYPVLKSLAKVRYEVMISGIADYKVLKANKLIGKWTIDLESYDCYIIGMKNYEETNIRINNMYFNFYSMNRMGNTIVKTIIKYLGNILRFYNEKFGNKKKDNILDILVAPRLNGGGYCREDLIVISECESIEEDLIKFFAHEIAHIWWTNAEVINWEDWLNESYAEYSAWLYIENEFGNESYDNIINSYKEATKDCPKIMGIDRNDSKAYISRFKGALLLHEFRKKYGDNELQTVFNTLTSLRMKTTKNLLNEIKLSLGKEQAKFIYDMLNS